MKRFILEQYRIFSMQTVWMKVLYAVLLFYVLITSFREGDIDFFLDTGNRFLNHQNLYLENYRGSIYFVYSPIFSFLISPFTFLPAFLVRFMWGAANIYFIFEIARIVFSYLPQNEFLRKRKGKILFISILFTVHFFNLNFMIGQMTICMLYICLKSIYENDKGNFVGASFLLALGIMLKVMPVIILVYYLYNRNIRTCFMTLFWIEILVIVPFIFVQPGEMLTHYYYWFNAMSNGGGGFEREYLGSMHSLHSLAIEYFTNHQDAMDNAWFLPFDRCIANLPISQVKMISYSASALLIILTLKVLNRMPFTQSQSKLHTLYEFGYICLITPLIFPMQQKYGYLFIFPGVVYLLYAIEMLRSHGRKYDLKVRIFYVCLVLGFIFASLSTVDALVGYDIKNLSQYYKWIVWGTLILIIPYLMFPPKAISAKVQE